MAKAKIKIEMIHDVVCSWCPIGYSNIKAALVRLEDQLEAEITFLPFELNPEMPEAGEGVDLHLMRRNRWNREQWLRYREDLVETAKKAGLVYDFNKRTHYWNTVKAHTLIHYAESFGKQEQINEALVHEYFTEGMNVDDTQSLLGVAESVGLDRMETQAALLSVAVAVRLQIKRERAREFNVRNVPTFIFNDVEVVSGSNSTDYFVRYFTYWLANMPAQKNILRVR